MEVLQLLRDRLATRHRACCLHLPIAELPEAILLRRLPPGSLDVTSMQCQCESGITEDSLAFCSQPTSMLVARQGFLWGRSYCSRVAEGFIHHLRAMYYSDKGVWLILAGNLGFWPTLLIV